MFQKLIYIKYGYYACGQDPSFDHFKAILADIEDLESVLSAYRFLTCYSLSLISGLKVPPIDDSAAIKDSTKLLEFMQTAALREGYKFCNGFVLKQVIVQLPGNVVHATPYWERVRKSEQLRKSLSLIVKPC